MYNLVFDFSNKITCYYQGNPDKCNPGSKHLDPRILPDECDAILYEKFDIDQKSVINVDEGKLNNFYFIYLHDIMSRNI